MCHERWQPVGAAAHAHTLRLRMVLVHEHSARQLRGCLRGAAPESRYQHDIGTFLCNEQDAVASNEIGSSRTVIQRYEPFPNLQCRTRCCSARFRQHMNDLQYQRLDMSCSLDTRRRTRKGKQHHRGEMLGTYFVRECIGTNGSMSHCFIQPVLSE